MASISLDSELRPRQVSAPQKFSEITQRLQSYRSVIDVESYDRPQTVNWLAELHAIDYFIPQLIDKQQALLLINSLIRVISTNDIELVEQVAILILKLTRHQLVRVEGNTLKFALMWCLSVLHQGLSEKAPPYTPYIRVIQTLEALVRDNPNCRNRRYEFFNVICGNRDIMTYMERVAYLEWICMQAPLVRAAEAVVTIPDEASDRIEPTDLDNLFVWFLNRTTVGIRCLKVSPEGYINTVPEMKIEPTLVSLLVPDYLEDDDNSRAAMLRHALSGIHAILHMKKYLTVPNSPVANLLMNVCRIYMVQEMCGVKYYSTTPIYPLTYCNRRQIIRMGTESWPPPQKFPRHAKRQPRRLPRRVTSTLRIRPETSSDNFDGDTPMQVPALQAPVLRKEHEIQVAHALNTPDGLRAMKLRLEALLLLQTVFKCVDKETLKQFFVAFLTNETKKDKVAMPSGFNLLHCILKDPSPSCRTAAHICLQYLITECKYLISQAEGKDPCTQTVMSDVIVQVHHALCLGMNEPSAKVLTQLLKTTAHLIRFTNYEWVKSGLCLKILRNIKPVLDHKDISVQVGVLTIIGCLLSKGVKEIEEAFVQTIEDDSVSNVASNSRPWLIEHCFWILRPESSSPAPIKIECLQILSAMCERFFETLIYPFLKYTGETVLSAFSLPENLDVLHHAMKAMEQLGLAMNHFNEFPGCLDESLSMWNVLLNDTIIDFSSDDFGGLRAGAADCISAIGKHVFELLPSNVHKKCITVLLSLSMDCDTNVRSAAVRGIGVLLLFPSARAYIGFVQDAANIFVRTISDCSVAVRVRASWGLGNLSDTMVNPDVEFEAVEDDYNMPALDPILRAAIKGSRDVDKIRCNAVRALGNLLQLLDEAGTHSQQRETLWEGVNALIDCANKAHLMKARWNACYALGNVLKLQAVYTRMDNESLRLSESIFYTLACIITDCTNIKVRINAAQAVTSCKTRDGYGENYFPLWGALVNGLITVENIVDVNEYQQRDKLTIQTCVTLGHMTRVIMPDDLAMLEDIVADGADSLLVGHVKRVYDSLQSENTATLIEAEQRLQEISSTQLSCNARRALDTLTTIFHHELDP